VFQGSASGLRFDLWLPVTSAVDLAEGGKEMKELLESRAARLAITAALYAFAIRYCLWRESRKAQAVPINCRPRQQP
jgi:hypothetical protein